MWISTLGCPLSFFFFCKSHGSEKTLNGIYFETNTVLGAFLLTTDSAFFVIHLKRFERFEKNFFDISAK